MHPFSKRENDSVQFLLFLIWVSHRETESWYKLWAWSCLCKPFLPLMSTPFGQFCFYTKHSGREAESMKMSFSPLPPNISPIFRLTLCFNQGLGFICELLCLSHHWVLGRNGWLSTQAKWFQTSGPKCPGVVQKWPTGLAMPETRFQPWPWVLPVWSLQVLPVTAWDTSLCSGFLPRPNDMLVGKLNGRSISCPRE